MTCIPYPFPPTFCGATQFPPCNPFTYPHVIELFTVPASAGLTVTVKVTHTYGLYVGEGVRIANQNYIINAIDSTNQTITIELANSPSKTDVIVNAIHPSFACYMTPVVPVGLVTKTTRTVTINGYVRSGVSSIAASISSVADSSMEYGYLGPATLYLRGDINVTTANNPYWLAVDVPDAFTVDTSLPYPLIGWAVKYNGTDPTSHTLWAVGNGKLLMGPGGGVAIGNASGVHYCFGAIVGLGKIIG